MRTLILGSGGFIGGALAAALPFARRSSHHECDLTKPDHCGSVVAYADLVYLCAGVTGGAALMETDPLSLVTPNVIMHLNVFRACKDAGVKKVVCLSSTTGYPDTDLPMSEDDYFTGEPHPAYFNPGHARRFIERLGAMYPELEIVFLRPSVVYGPGDDFDPATSHVIPALVRKVAERQNPITVWGDGRSWRDGVYIDDMVRALVLAGDAPAGAYNVASGDGMTVTEMLVHLQAASGHNPDVQYDATKPSMLKKRVLNIEKSKRVMGWEPSVRMADGLVHTLNWYRNQ